MIYILIEHHKASIEIRFISPVWIPLSVQWNCLWLLVSTIHFCWGGHTLGWKMHHWGLRQWNKGSYLSVAERLWNLIGSLWSSTGFPQYNFHQWNYIKFDWDHRTRSSWTQTWSVCNAVSMQLLYNTRSSTSLVISNQWIFSRCWLGDNVNASRLLHNFKL